MVKRRFKKRYLWIWIVFILLSFISFGGNVNAHFSSTGYSDITVHERVLNYSLYLSDHDMLEAEPALDMNGDLRLTESDLEDNGKLATFINDGLIVTGDGKVGEAKIRDVQFTVKAKTPVVQVDLEYPFEHTVGRYMIQYAFFYDGTDSEHRSFASIDVNGQVIEQVVNNRNNIIQIQGVTGDTVGTGYEADGPASVNAADASWTDTFREFTWMGMEHIWSGLDHLLFVLGLLLAAADNRWTLIKLITSFTVGHSITLVLSALELASLSPLVVEPLIALSIFYIAIDYILRKTEAAKQVWITLGFGMIHGFGFAEILHGAFSSNVAWPLFSFNLGVEIGQITVVLLLLPVLWGIRRLIKLPVWSRYAMGAIGVIGLYWFAERVLSHFINKA